MNRLMLQLIHHLSISHMHSVHVFKIVTANPVDGAMSVHVQCSKQKEYISNLEVTTSDSVMYIYTYTCIYSQTSLFHTYGMGKLHKCQNQFGGNFNNKNIKKIFN